MLETLSCTSVQNPKLTSKVVASKFPYPKLGFLRIRHVMQRRFRIIWVTQGRCCPNEKRRSAAQPLFRVRKACRRSKWCYGEGRKPSSIGKIRNVVGAHKLWLVAVITKHAYVARLSQARLRCKRIRPVRSSWTNGQLLDRHSSKRSSPTRCYFQNHKFRNLYGKSIAPHPVVVFPLQSNHATTTNILRKQ